MTAPALQPQVTGRLAETEAAIISLIAEQGADASFRSSISMEASLALAAVRAAAKERRESLSNLLAAAVAEYTQRHGEPAPALVELFSKLQAAAAANPSIIGKVETALRNAQRQRKTAA